MTAQRPRRRLYLMTAFGLKNPWVLWSLSRGALDEWCPQCRGFGFLASRPCECVETAGRQGWPDETCNSCSNERGCRHCRVLCPECRGARVVAGEPLMAEDFGDLESRRIAERLFPGLDIDDDPYHVRMDTRHLR